MDENGASEQLFSGMYKSCSGIRAVVSLEFNVLLTDPPRLDKERRSDGGVSRPENVPSEGKKQSSSALKDSRVDESIGDSIEVPRRFGRVSW